METTVTTITRVKRFPTPGTNYRFAWKWMYYVNGDHGTDTLYDARRIAKRMYPGTPVVESWRTAG